ncbi:helix-turn-helix domain-containing protein [Pedobacter sp. LMG 31464]|uniref:Helix-turn-helix domain-containing protein n=1 Tax=Pedobacter planticolens TaxID=2679964 RepID=A0A923IVA2_9SPHI|nr:helix-turn-helix domain-containing protein [Pedobacter planticolens]MBB2146835.1 helix-turn-helix domain-containing protein [Pedobacter planticolens]
MEKPTFDQLPEAIVTLYDKLLSIEKMLTDLKFGYNLPEQDLLTIQQASELVTLAVPTLYSKVSLKEIPFCKKGKRLYFSKSELLKWVKSGVQETNGNIVNGVENKFLAIHSKK